MTKDEKIDFLGLISKPLKANVILYGNRNSGKTQTLRILYLMLGGKNPKFLNKGNTWKRETLTYNHQIIGICLDGDTLEIVEGNVAFFANNNCDVAFSPTHIGGPTVMPMQYFIEKNTESAKNCNIECTVWKKQPELRNHYKVSIEKDKLLNLSVWKKAYPQSYAMAEKLKKLLDDGFFF